MDIDYKIKHKVWYCSTLMNLALIKLCFQMSNFLKNYYKKCQIFKFWYWQASLSLIHIQIRLGLYDGNKHCPFSKLFWFWKSLFFSSSREMVDIFVILIENFCGKFLIGSSRVTLFPFYCYQKKNQIMKRNYIAHNVEMVGKFVIIS
jgi:hypothetical protein